MKRGGSHYYKYIAMKRDSREDLYTLKLEIDYILKKETSMYKLIPELFKFMKDKKRIKEFINWLEKENRIATILKRL